jgi:YD repeat-containing protein
MPNIIVTETTGTQQVVGPDNNLNFIVSGSHSGDNVTINASGSQTSVNIDVTDSSDNITVTGVASPQDISVIVNEGVRPDAVGPFDTAFVYNSLGQLVQSIANITTDFSYNAAGQLIRLERPDFTKDFYYSGTFLTGIDVTDL